MARQNTPVGIREILIVNAGGDLSPQVQQGLRDKKYATRTVQGVAAVKNAIKAFTEPILVFEAGPSPITLEQCVKEISVLAAEIKLPIILIGDGADAFERELDKLYPAATTLNIPYGAAEILAAVNYISRTYLERKVRVSAAAPSTPPATETATREAVDGETHKLYSGGFTIPNLVFGQLDRLDLFGKNLGGPIFSSPELSVEYLSDHRMLPNDLKVQEAIRGLCIDAGKWGRMHLARTSYMAQKILDGMNPDQQLRDHLKSAAFLYAWSFAGTNAALLQRIYLDNRGSALRLELCSRIKDSAMNASGALKLDQPSKIIASVARFIGREAQIGDDDVSITASAIMAADITSRICFQNGPWNPRRAYVLLSRLKKGEIQDLHPAVLCCTVKFLAEALAARTPLFLLKKELRQNKEFIAALQAEARKPVAKGEKRVPLSALVPGMKLSKPLRALDGKEVLSPDLILDEDLIWRIWQLSAIRPLTSAIISNTTN